MYSCNRGHAFKCLILNGIVFGNSFFWQDEAFNAPILKKPPEGGLFKNEY